MSEALAGWQRTHVCGAVRSADCGKEVIVMGWVQKRRDHGGLIFIDLRDRYGLVQIVFDPDSGAENFAKAERVRNEYVLAVKGLVEARPEGTVNPNLATGEIEIRATELKVLSAAKTPPFNMDDEAEVDEKVRLKYRYLDLRRPSMQNNIILRHKVTMAVRKFMDENDFLEIETPMLAKSTPEGAREYLVPSRVHPGEFYVLPQSPQLFKQILMVAGMDKYFQIVRCFRDEDLRADRQPEFTQLDIEMSFVTEESIQALMEKLIAYVFKATLNVDVPFPFPRLTYAVAMERYGSDKPDLRFGLELVDVADIVAESNFKVFANIIQKGGRVKAINATGCAHYSRKEIDELTQFAAIYGAKGLAWMQVTEEGCKSSITKFFSEEQLKALAERMKAKPGDLLLFVADKAEVVFDSLGHLRQEIARREGLIDVNEFNFSWVTEFPLLEYSEEEKRYVAKHHPFTSPMDEDIDLIATDPAKVRTKAYDMVLNGIELGGGSIRIHQRDVQTKIFDLLGYSKEESEQKFGFLLTAFDYGVPPHGGLAFGLDRMIMLMAKRDSIRDVIAFPKNQSATDLMTQAPSPVEDKQLRDLHIRVNVVKKEAKEDKN